MHGQCVIPSLNIKSKVNNIIGPTSKRQSKIYHKIFDKHSVYLQSRSWAHFCVTCPRANAAEQLKFRGQQWEKLNHALSYKGALIFSAVKSSLHTQSTRSCKSDRTLDKGRFSASPHHDLEHPWFNKNHHVFAGSFCQLYLCRNAPDGGFFKGLSSPLSWLNQAKKKQKFPAEDNISLVEAVTPHCPEKRSYLVKWRLDYQKTWSGDGQGPCLSWAEWSVHHCTQVLSTYGWNCTHKWMDDTHFTNQTHWSSALELISTYAVYKLLYLTPK